MTSPFTKMEGLIKHLNTFNFYFSVLGMEPKGLMHVQQMLHR